MLCFCICLKRDRNSGRLIVSCRVFDLFECEIGVVDVIQFVLVLINFLLCIICSGLLVFVIISQGHHGLSLFIVLVCISGAPSLSLRVMSEISLVT